MPAFESPFRAQGLGVTDENSWLDEEHAEAISEDANYLVECLAAIHGDIRLAKERSGLHAYMASPACLATDGLIELQKKHLAVNLDKAMAEESNCALCMKTSTRFTVSNLLRMRPLEERMENYKGKKRVYWGAQVSPNDLEIDANGNQIPKWPGTCYNLSDLPEGHQALHWLSKRKMVRVGGNQPLRCVVFAKQETTEIWLLAHRGVQIALVTALQDTCGWYAPTESRPNHKSRPN